MNKTKIEYLTHTWNPIAMRCTPCSPGCENCWHLRMCKRMAVNEWSIMPELRARYSGERPPMLNINCANDPRHHKKPCRIGVQFMGDLFHDAVKDRDIAHVMQTINESPRHTFLVLTKRDHRMRCFMNEMTDAFLGGEPMPNLWLGVSVSNQEEWDKRIGNLRAANLAHRWVSVEPMLGPVEMQTTSPDWVVCGAETGPHKRTMSMLWYEKLRDQCIERSVPFFGKVDSQGQKLEPREYP